MRRFALSFGLSWLLAIPLAGIGAASFPPAAAAVQQSSPSTRESSDSADSTKSAQDESAESSSDESEPPGRPASFDRQNADILHVVDTVKAQAEMVTVAVMSTNRKIALGTIVDPDGLILTKASELKGNLFCKLSDGRVLSAEVFGIHRPTDLALLKVAASGLPTAHWSESGPPPVGYWLITPRPEESPSLGIVSVQAREIAPSPGFMGVTLFQGENGIRVNQVIPDSPAEAAGIQVNDIIIALDDTPQTDRNDLIQNVQKHPAGDQIELTIMRDGKEKKVRLKLVERTEVESGGDRSNFQNEMGGRLSTRRLGFPLAIQHDTTLSPNDCGGPIVDLTGGIVGLNIARAGRVDSLALPVSTVLSAIESLKTGNLAPAVLNKSEIDAIVVRLAEIEAEMADLPPKTQRLAAEADSQRIREEEIQAVIDDLQGRLDEIKARRSSLESELQSAKSGVESFQKEKERLERDLNKLRSGTN